MSNGSSEPRGQTINKAMAIGTIVAFAVLVIGSYYFATEKPYCLFSKCRSIEALDVTLQSPGIVAGKIKLVDVDPPAVGFDRESTNGLGGGCVIFRSPSGETCEKFQCSLPAGLAHAYCSQEQTCWLKISENHCWKSGASTQPVPLALNVEQSTPDVNLFEARDALYPTSVGPGFLEARIVACLNGNFSGPPPCKTENWSNAIEVFGKARVFELDNPPERPLAEPPEIPNHPGPVENPDEPDNR